MDGLWLLISLSFLVLTLFLWNWQWTKSNDTLEQWAADNGFNIISKDRRHLFRGRFTLTSGKGQEVFYITVRDKDGNEQKGYVRVGSFVIGQFSNRVDVAWD